MNLAQTIDGFTGERLSSNGEWVKPYYTPTLTEDWLMVRTHQRREPVYGPENVDVMKIQGKGAKMVDVLALFQPGEELMMGELNIRGKEIKGIRDRISQLVARGHLHRVGTPQKYRYSLK